MSQASGSDSLDTEGTLTIVCERVTPVEHQLRELQTQVRACQSRLNTLERGQPREAVHRLGFLQFLACCWSRPHSLDNYHE